MQKVRNLNVKPVATPSRNLQRGSYVNVNFKMSHQVSLPAATWKQASGEERCRLCKQEVFKYIVKHLKLQPCIDINNKLPVCDKVPSAADDIMTDIAVQQCPVAVLSEDGGELPESKPSQQDPWSNWPGWQQQPKSAEEAKDEKSQRRPSGWVEVPVIEVE